MSEVVRIAKKRRAEIRELREAGCKFRVIGEIYGVSAARAQQLYKASLLDDKEKPLKKYLFADEKDEFLKEVLSTRAYNALLRIGITNREELLRANTSMISRARNIGKKTFAEIMRVREVVKL